MKKRFEVEFAIGDLKAVKIARRLFSQFYNRQGFFANYFMPEYVLPRNLKDGSREHALFLTYVISIDYMTDAEKLWKKSRGAYELYSERFTPEQLLKVSPKSVEVFVRKLGARFGSTAAKIWVDLSKILSLIWLSSKLVPNVSSSIRYSQGSHFFSTLLIGCCSSRK